MAIVSLREQVGHLIASELNPGRRYRCLILQTADLAILGRICEDTQSILDGTGREPCILSWENFFDAVGALSLDEARRRIDAAGGQRSVILTGPLHFVDYWTSGVQDGFWNFLSLYSRGPGIVLVDTPRTDGVEGPFTARGTIPGTEIRYLRPRLVATEETPL